MEGQLHDAKRALLTHAVNLMGQGADTVDADLNARVTALFEQWAGEEIEKIQQIGTMLDAEHDTNQAGLQASLASEPIRTPEAAMQSLLEDQAAAAAQQLRAEAAEGRVEEVLDAAVGHGEL